QIDRGGRRLDGPQAETGARERNPGACRLDEMPTCEHGVLLTGLFFSWQGLHGIFLCPSRANLKRSFPTTDRGNFDTPSDGVAAGGPRVPLAKLQHNHCATWTG